MGKVCVLLAMAVAGAWAETPADYEARVRAAMAPSLDKQRISVQTQVAAAVPSTAPPPAAESGFFTTPWPGFLSAAIVVQAPCEPLAPTALRPLVDEAAKREGVEVDLVNAVIDRESGARPCAVSVKGAQGLMQLMPAVASELGVKDAFDPKQNVDGGTKLLKQLLTKYNGDVGLALGAYNAGPARVDRDGGIPKIPETINYVSDILTKVAK